MISRLFLLIFASIFSGCTTGYLAKQGERPEGYSEEKLGDSLFRVSYETYRNSMEWGQISDFTLMRAAEIGKENDFIYFVIKKSEKEDFIKPSISRGNSVQTNIAPISNPEIASNISGTWSTPDIIYEFNVRRLNLVVKYTNIEEPDFLKVADVLHQIGSDYDF